MIDAIIAFNKAFVANARHRSYLADKHPRKKLAVLSCMDTRLTELLMAAMGLRNGDATMIKTAGALVMSPFDAAMRSILVSVYELGVTQVMVVGHTDCGACHMSYAHFHDMMTARGIAESTLVELLDGGVPLETWLEGFHDVQASVRNTVDVIGNHPLMPDDVVVRGFVIDTPTGQLTPVD